MGTHEHPERIVDHSNADVGPDSYHQFEEDIKALKEVGVSSLIKLEKEVEPRGTQFNGFF